MARTSNKSGTLITYLPGPGDPPSVTWQGVVFYAHEPKIVTKSGLIKKARTNKSFHVGDGKLQAAALSVALGELYRSLQETVRLPSRVALDPIKELHKRQISALMLIARFLKRTSAGNDVADLFADLAIALHGLDVGIGHPMFEVSKKIGPRGSAIGGRSNDRSDVWRLRILAANGVEILIRGGCSRQKAASQAANDFPGLKKLLRPSSGSPPNKRRTISLESSLLSWFDATAKGTLEDPVAAGFAQNFRKQIEVFATQLSSEQMAALGKNLLQSASNQAVELLLTNPGAAAKKQSKEGILLRRLPPSRTKALDKWITRQKGKLTRPEAIRRIVEEALAAFSGGPRAVSAGI
jgi:hypothetical protein